MGLMLQATLSVFVPSGFESVALHEDVLTPVQDDQSTAVGWVISLPHAV